jgi:hypothetical protein
LVQSNGTSACTNESGRTFYFSVGGVDYGSGGSISAISSAMGLYECLFSASKVSVMGQGRVYYGGVNSSSTAMVASTPIEIVAWNSYDSMRLGLFALPNADPTAAGGLITFGTGTNQLHVSSGSVGLKAQTHSGATITGINNILAGTYSGVTIDGVNRVNSSVTPANATYSAITVRLDSYDYSSKVTVGVGSILAASYSGVTIQGVSNTSSAADLLTDIWAPATHSGVSIEIKTGGIQTTSIGKGSYSGVTVGIDNIKANAYSGVTVDGAKFLSTAGERSVASSYLSTNMGNNRLVQEAYFTLRNKFVISGSTMTVYMTDDSTSAFTATVSTGTATVYGVDPTG